MEAIELIQFLISPENVLSFLGFFSILAKITPWDWDDKLAEKPENIKAVANTASKIIHVIGLTKSAKK